MPLDRMTNQEICEQFRKLITFGAQRVLSEEEMRQTKPWRDDMWRAFREIENRLCPKPQGSANVKAT